MFWKYALPAPLVAVALPVLRATQESATLGVLPAGVLEVTTSLKVTVALKVSYTEIVAISGATRQ